jgi:hypothetical protein
LGRRLRLNSWDMLRDPGEVIDQTLDAFDMQGTLTFVVVVFFVLLILYRLLAFLDDCIVVAWRQRLNPLSNVDVRQRDRHSDQNVQHHHHHSGRRLDQY